MSELDVDTRTYNLLPSQSRLRRRSRSGLGVGAELDRLVVANERTLLAGPNLARVAPSGWL